MTVEDQLKVFVQNNQCSFGLSVYVLDTGEDGVQRLGREIEFAEYDPTTVNSPTLSLGNHTAQMLIDQLWNCGIRPSEGSGSAGQLASTQRHLADMRAIAAKFLRVQWQKGGE